MADAQRVAVVTGSGRGIGRGIALRLARDGMDVAINDMDAEKAKAVAEEVRDLGVGSAVAVADVSDRDAAFAMVDAVVDELGGLDVIVNNAGIARTKTLLDTTPEDLDALFGVNVHGVVFCVQAAATAMRTRGGGKIINAASIAGHSGFDYLGAYSADTVDRRHRPCPRSGHEGVSPARPSSGTSTRRRSAPVSSCYLPNSSRTRVTGLGRAFPPPSMKQVAISR